MAVDGISYPDQQVNNKVNKNNIVQNQQKENLSGYISNPFKVILESLKQFFELNLPTAAILYLILIVLTGGIIAIGLLAFVSLVAASFNNGQNLSGISLLLISLFMIIFILFTTFIQAALFKYSIATARGEVIGYKEALSVGKHKFLGFLGVTLLLAIIITLGFILLIIPGIIFMYWFTYAPFVYIDEEVGVIEAFRRSKGYVKGKAGDFFGLIFTSQIVNIPSLIPFIGWIYSLVAMPVLLVSNSYRYVSFKAVAKGELTKESTHFMNYVVIWLAPLLFVLFFVISIIRGPDSSEFDQSPMDTQYELQFDS